MQAAAAGKSNIGIPAKVGKEFAKADKGGSLPSKIGSRLSQAVNSKKNNMGG